MAVVFHLLVDQRSAKDHGASPCLVQRTRLHRSHAPATDALERQTDTISRPTSPPPAAEYARRLAVS
jgi:hypothetical protein